MIRTIRYLFLIGLLVAYYFDSIMGQIVSMFGYAVTLLLQDFRGGIVRRLDISTTFSIMLVLTSFSHFVAISGWIDAGDSWATYVIPKYMDKGLFIFSIGSCIIMEVLRRSIKQIQIVSPQSGESDLFTWIFVLSALVFVANHFKLIPSLGSLTSFVKLLVNGSVFLLAFLAHSSYKNYRVYLVAVYVLILSLYAIQFSFLRMEIVVPWLAYFSGEILARRKILAIHWVSKVILLIGIIVFPLIFTYLGTNRSNLSGRSEKLQRVLQEGTSLEEIEGGETMLGRLNVLGQTSNIINLTEKKGFYNGQTLAYFSFVFIPRFLWPDKPVLDGGQWFAVEIGRSYYLPSGRAPNSVNMTVPGEMYLNFGFTGLVIGCVLFGLFIGYTWRLIDGNGLTSWTFRFYLLFLGIFSLGSDLMIVPQLVAYMLIYKSIIFLKNNIHV